MKRVKRGIYAIAGLLAVLMIGAIGPAACPSTLAPEKAERQAKTFVLGRMRGPGGAILTNGKVRRVLSVPSRRLEDLLASGVLSESVGLAMQYAVLADDRALFDEQLTLARKKMMGQFGLFYWKISYDGDLVASTSASVDDLRIVGACLAAWDAWHAEEYRAFAHGVAAKIRQYEMVDGALRDYFNWREHNGALAASSLQLSYIDTPTLKRLAKEDSSWQIVLERSGKLLLKGQRESGLFYEKYNFNEGRYEGERQNVINQLYCALFAAELEEDHPFAAWLNKQFARNGTLLAEYDSGTGEPTQFYESTAVYALAARYAIRIGQKELSEKLIRKLLYLQNANPLSPLYGGFCNDEVYSFDNLEALITLRLYNARR